jgi:beta-N-acetylhexosaminidase
LQRQTVDGLLVSHIRYRGFQGNIRANTSPISLDPQAHQALMQLPEVAPWRNAGGVTFSDVLGVQSVRRFYDPLDTSFNARRVARDAFSAGNDVLILGNFALTNSWQEQIANIRDTLQFFKLQYVNDQQFAAKVDAALTRIISLKLRMYGLSTTTITATSATSPFNINDAQVDINNLGTLGAPSEATTRLLNTIGKDSLTLIAPSIRDLSSLITSPPSKDDAIVFITDDRQLRDCARCNLYQAISRTALQDIAVNLYGPRTTGQINPNKINSITFSDLAEVLKPVTNTSSSGIAITANLTATTSIITPTESSAITRTNIVTRLQSVIEQSNWIVIGMLDFNTVYKSTQIFRDFLSQRSDLLRDKKVVLFAFGAPYYLDATEISKLTAYYGIFSRTPIAYETAIRTLFGEFSSAGNSPVSVASINYSIIAQTAPNPNQVIPLVAPDTFTNTAQLQPSQQQIDVKVNDKLKLRAGPVIDRNNRIVPDGTPVQFILTYPAERLDLPIITQPSKSGFAEATITIDRKGNLTARVQSDQATTSYTLRVNTGDTNTQIETIKPTPQPSPSPLPIPTTFVRPTEIPSVTITPTPTVITRVVRANLTGFVLVLLAMGLLGLLTNFALQNTRRVSALYRWRVILWGWIAGWLAYVFVAMGLPGSNQISVNFGWMGGALLALVTAVFVIAVLFLFQFASHLKDTN